MKRSTKLLLGIATVWPLLYMLLFFAVVFSAILLAPHTPGSGAFPAALLVILPLHFLTIFLILGLTIFYIVNIIKNERVDNTQKIIWTVALFFGSLFAMPIYWYLHIWREEPTTLTTVKTSPPPSLNSADASYRANNTTSNERGREYIPPSQPPNWR